MVRVTTPISIAWPDLVAAVTNGGTLANGWYFLLVRTVEFDGLEGPAPDPSQRAVADPMLDIRQDSFVEVWLSTSIGALPVSRTPAALALALNTFVGGLTPASMASAVGNGVPLALVLVLNGQAILLSQAAGRLPADPDGLNAMLLAQMREAFAMALTETGANPALGTWQTTIRARFRFLPGAGELPVGMLLTPEAVTASCPFFPPGMAVYLQSIRASQAPHLLHEALGRSQLDLTSNTAEAVTLALAIPDAAWTPDLLDIPRGDPVLAADTHLAYARARAAQVTLREDWIALYGGMTAVVAAQSQAIGFLMASDTAARNLSYLLTLPPPAGSTTPALTVAGLLTAADDAASPLVLLPLVAAWIAALATTPPPTALAIPSVPTTDAPTAAQQIAALGYRVVDDEPAQADPTIAGHVPVASDAVLAPLIPFVPTNSDFAHWSAAISLATPDPVLLQPLIDAGIVDANATATARAAAITALLALPAPGDARNDDYATRRTAPTGVAATLLCSVRPGGTSARDVPGCTQPAARTAAPAPGYHVHLCLRAGRRCSVRRERAELHPPHPIRKIHAHSTNPYSCRRGRCAIPAPHKRPDNSRLSIHGYADIFAGARYLSHQRGCILVSAFEHGQQFARCLTAAVQSRHQRRRDRTNAVQSIADNLRADRQLHGGVTIGQHSQLNQTDVAQSVAQQIGAISQAPTFQYTPVKYGSASYVDGSAPLLNTANAGVTNLRNIMSVAPFNIPLTSLKPIGGASTSDPNTNYGNIITTTSGLLDDINKVESNALRIESAYLAFRDRIVSLEARIAQLTDLLASARDTLRSSQATAAQTAGDYAAAQQLVLEETARVNTATASRHQAITAATGLFYVRELQTLITRDLPPSISLTADTPADLVPGCLADHAGPPGAIQPFLDLLLEVPLADWWPLRDGWTYLPEPTGIQRLGALRATRLASWTFASNFGSGAAASDLVGLANTTRDAFDPVFRSAVNISASLAETQQAAFAVFALPDIVALPVSILRTNAEALRARMESATGCLFETLTALPPSARFAWASLARAGTLPTLDFTQWPVPAGLGDAGTAALRRLAALVNWMAGQLHDRSSAASRTALGNLVAAAVIAAAYGDPNEAVTGTVTSSGGVPRPGVPIRVVLTRLPPIGTVLDLLDANQSIVGTLRVQDHDPLATTASVVTSHATTAPTSGWTVAARGGRAPWLPS